MSEIGEDWKDWKQESKLHKDAKQKWNTDVVGFIAGELEFKLTIIQPYQLRLNHAKTGKNLDYFPRSGKATWLGSGKWFVITDIEQWLYKNFK